MENERFPYAARRFNTTLAVREMDEAGRTIFGTVVPYDEVATVNDGQGPYRERFAPGAFTRSIEQTGGKVPLYPQHNSRELPIARGSNWQDTSSGLYGEFVIPNTRAGDDVLVLVQDGIVDSFSVGFRGIKARDEGGVTVRTEAALLEVSLVASPAYKNAVVAGVRAADLDVAEIEDWVNSLDPATRAALVAALVPAPVGTDTHPDETTPAVGTGDPTKNLRALRARLLAVN